MEYMLDCSLERQDNLAQEEGNKGVKYMRERWTIGHMWDKLERRSNHTHLRDMTREEMGTRQIGISKQEGKLYLTQTEKTLDTSIPDKRESLCDGTAQLCLIMDPLLFLLLAVNLFLCLRTPNLSSYSIWKPL